MRLDEQKDWLKALDADLRNLTTHQLKTAASYYDVCREVSTACNGFTGFINRQSEITMLMFRAGLIIHNLELAIGEYLSKPSSYPWRAGGDGPVQQEWLRLLLWQHAECLGFSARLQVSVSAVLGTTLLEYLSKPYSDAGMSEWRSALNSHMADLVGLRQTYAAKFSDPLAEKVKDTIS